MAPTYHMAEGLILMISGSTQPAERPVTAHSGNVLSTWQHSIMGHVATEERNTRNWKNVIISVLLT